jgi:uncharacterized protein (DUF1015 family)
MADIRGFRGWRYNLAVVGSLSDVIAPPYDVIDEPLVRRLLARSPYNVVRLELPQLAARCGGFTRPPAPDESTDRATPTVAGEGQGGEPTNEELPANSDWPYVEAARLLRRWKREAVLVQESDPAVYVYHQEFSLEGQVLVRRGFLALLRVVPFGQGVQPHEETFPGPKQDRLKLLQHTEANTSPVFGIYEDEEGQIQEYLDRYVLGRPPLQAQDETGTIHRIWPVTQPAALTAAVAYMADRVVYLADGHHRYETALAYCQTLRQQRGGSWSDEEPENFLLIGLVATGDPGLRILPTHRLLSGCGVITGRELRQRLEGPFELDFLGQGPSGAEAAWTLVQAAAPEPWLAFGTSADRDWFVAQPRDELAVQRLYPERSSAWCRLAVNFLHELALPRLLATRHTPSVRYVHGLDQAVEAVEQRQADLACLVAAPSIADLRAVASAGERMPPKSTYFYPKLSTGLVLRVFERPEH